MALKVRALEWSKNHWWNQVDPDNDHLIEVWQGFGAGHIQAWIEHQRDGKFYTEGQQFKSIDDAKSSAQAHYETILLSAIET